MAQNNFGLFLCREDNVSTPLAKRDFIIPPDVGAHNRRCCEWWKKALEVVRYRALLEIQLVYMREDTTALDRTFEYVRFDGAMSYVVLGDGEQLPCIDIVRITVAEDDCEEDAPSRMMGPLWMDSTDPGWSLELD